MSAGRGVCGVVTVLMYVTLLMLVSWWVGCVRVNTNGVGDLLEYK